MSVYPSIRNNIINSDTSAVAAHSHSYSFPLPDIDQELHNMFGNYHYLPYAYDQGYTLTNNDPFREVNIQQQDLSRWLNHLRNSKRFKVISILPNSLVIEDMDISRRLEFKSDFKNILKDE